MDSLHPLQPLREWIAQIVREEVEVVLKERGSLDSPGKYLSTAQAGELAGVTPGTIRRWVREGRLQAAGAGRDVRVLLGEVEALVRNGRRHTKKQHVQLTDEQRVQRAVSSVASRLGIGR